MENKLINNNNNSDDDSSLNSSDYTSDTSGSNSDSSSECANKELGNEFRGKLIVNNSNNNKYIILDKLGCGAFASVWIGYSLTLKSLVAIKIYHPLDYIDSIKELEVYEKIITSKINTDHILTSIEEFDINHIVELEEYFDNDGTINEHKVIILPLLACSSYDLLKYDKYENGLPHNIVKTITKQLILSLIEFEKLNLIHTDLKPENILIDGKTYKMDILLNLINEFNIDEHINDDIKLTELTGVLLNKYKFEIVKNDQDDLDMIIPEYINDIKIKLCDFNLAYDLNSVYTSDIETQTRYYRAPEVIMGYTIVPKSDYWSIPCLMFELLTGEILFDPEKDDLRSRDVHHLYQIIELLGEIPNKMIDKAPKKKELFDNHKLINVKKKIQRWNLHSVLDEKYEFDINNKEIKFLMNIMNNWLVINPDKRPDLISMLSVFK
jgi:serine/threonine-protein kinase SRPK3